MASWYTEEVIYVLLEPAPFRPDLFSRCNNRSLVYGTGYTPLLPIPHTTFAEDGQGHSLWARGLRGWICCDWSERLGSASLLPSGRGGRAAWARSIACQGVHDLVCSGGAIKRGDTGKNFSVSHYVPILPGGSKREAFALSHSPYAPGLLHTPQGFSIRPRASVELFPSLVNFIEVEGHIPTHESTQKFLLYQYTHHSWAGWVASVQPTRSAPKETKGFDAIVWWICMRLCSEMRKSIGGNFKKWILPLKFLLTISWEQSRDWIEGWRRHVFGVMYFLGWV